MEIPGLDFRIPVCEKEIPRKENQIPVPVMDFPVQEVVFPVYETGFPGWEIILPGTENHIIACICNLFFSIRVLISTQIRTLMATLKLGLEDIKPSHLADKAAVIYNEMKDNANFPDPIIAIDVFKTAIDAFSKSITLAKDFGAVALTKREKHEQTVKSMIRRLAQYVTIVANGKKGIILSSGFAVRKKPVKILALDSPEECILSRAPFPGVVHVSWKSLRMRVNYCVEITQDDPAEPNPNWTAVGNTTRSKFDVEGLEPGQYYFFRVRAESANAKSAYCGPHLIMAA